MSAEIDRRINPRLGRARWLHANGAVYPMRLASRLWTLSVLYAPPSPQMLRPSEDLQ